MGRKPTIARSGREANDDRAIYNEVRAEFVRRGTTLNEWCRLNGINNSTAKRALRGQRSGPIARSVREMILAEVGIAA